MDCCDDHGGHARRVRSKGKMHKNKRTNVTLADIEELRAALGGAAPGGGGPGGGDCVPDTCMCPSDPWDQTPGCKNPCPGPACW